MPATMNAATASHESIEVEHLTRYRYATAVELAHHLAYLRPLEAPAQQVLRFDLSVQPEPMHHASDTDWMGNHRTCFTVNQPHRELKVQMQARVRVAATPGIDPEATLDWETTAERLRYAVGRRFEPACQFVQASPFVPRLPALRAWAAPAFAPARPVAAIGIELMARVHAEFAYRSASTAIDTPLTEVLVQRKGVCQDFAHVLIGALRSRGLAARYVSGYLLTEPAGDTAQNGALDAPWLGADASHAWVALWCPMADGSTSCWLELDPTNNVLPGARHVRLAVGRDYGDVTPLRGVIRGGGEHQLEVSVRTTRIG
jgi:transglutaminase-like putative cysteine protease